MNNIRKYAIWAHQELIGKILARAQTLGMMLSAEVETVARQCFIRICALRFMEINGYLPNQMRLFSLPNQRFQPQFFLEHCEKIEFGASLDFAKLKTLKDSGRKNDLGRYLFISLCNGLHSLLPDVFPPLDENIVSLIPEDIFCAGGIIDRLVHDIQESSFDAVHGIGVEIVGWLYQYFISESREEIIDPLYKKYITKEDIPTVTQVFTPDWVVKYIVDNSLGRYWIEHHPGSRLAERLPYYISDNKECPKHCSSSENTVAAPVNKARNSCREIKVLDPCVGAGHFLVYAVDVLMHIYREKGFSESDAIREIIQHNIYGLDIDDGVVQLSRFAVIMKGCQYDHDFLSRKMSPQIYQVRNVANNYSAFIDAVCGDDKQLIDKLNSSFYTMKNAGSIGSMIQFPELSGVIGDLNCSLADRGDNLPECDNDLNVIRLLSSQYDIVITNPPYLNKYDDILKKFILNHYKDYSGDLFSVFIYRCLQFCKSGGYAGLMTPNVWMFIKSYEKLRRYILTHHSIYTLVQLAKGSFFNDATVDVCAFVMQSQRVGKTGIYFRLENFPGNMKIQRQKLIEAIRGSDCSYRFTASSEFFKSLPGMQIGYWMGEPMIRAFRLGIPLNSIASPRQGLATTDNNKYLRHWFEIDFHSIGFGLDRQTAIRSNIKWFPYNKGGEFRKWYGNQDYVVNYQNDGEAIKKDVLTKYPYLKTPDYVVKNPDTYFNPCLSWSKISSGSVAFRYFPQGFLYDVSGCSIFFKHEVDLYGYAGFLNSVVCSAILEIISPTLNYETGHMAILPVLDFSKHRERIEKIVRENIALSREDWDKSETSWDFRRHPLV